MARFIICAIIRGLYCAFAAWAALAIALWIAAYTVIGHGNDYLGQGFPLTPTLPVNAASLGVEAAVASFFGAVIAGMIGAAINHIMLRSALLVLAYSLWYFIGLGTIGFSFAMGFGTTWGSGEILRELMLDPIWTPVSFSVGLTIQLLLLGLLA